MGGELDLLAAEWALEHGGPVDYFLAEAGRQLADAERLNPESPALLLRRARSSLLEAAWRTGRRENVDGILRTGLEAAERGLAKDPTNAEFLVVKGRLRLVGARNSGDDAARHLAAEDALAAFRSAAGLNPLFATGCRPFIVEAREILSAGPDHADRSGTM